MSNYGKVAKPMQDTFFRTIGIPGATFRPTQPNDEDFLYKLFVSYRAADFVAAGLPDEMMATLLRQQFTVRHRGLPLLYPQARHDIIERHGQAIGQVVIDHQSDHIHLLEVAILPDHRNLGLGGAMVRALQDAATAAGVPIRLTVLPHSRAITLYRRLGFAETGWQGPQITLEWHPPAA